MTLASDTVEVDTRSRILAEAERLFRDIGYQKTTVADIAKQLRMSPANVYRFFDSKKAINAAVANRLMSEVEEAAHNIVGGRGLASKRLRDLLLSIHAMNAERYVGDAKLHEMVAVAMEENWDVCEAHMTRIGTMIGALVAEGVARREFAVANAELAAMCIGTAMLRFFNPQMIAQCAAKPGPSIHQMIEFILAGISAPRQKKTTGLRPV